jgi:hypothetical protein
MAFAQGRLTRFQAPGAAASSPLPPHLPLSPSSGRGIFVGNHRIGRLGLCHARHHHLRCRDCRGWACRRADRAGAAPARPDVDVRIIEGGSRIGGNHLWSFFASDVAPADRWLTAPLICHGWRSYDVAFPELARTLRQGYYSIESRRLDAVVRAACPNMQ